MEGIGGGPAQVDPARAEREPDWRAICEQAPIGLAMVGLDRGLRWANQTWCAPIGLHQRDVASTALDDVVHARDRDRVREFARRAAIGSGLGGIAPVRFVHRDGSDVVQMVAIAASYDAAGAQTGWIVQTHPAEAGPMDRGTQPVQMAAVDAENQRLAALLERSSDIICVVDSQGLITYYSPSAQRLLGYSAEHWKGTPFSTIMHPDERDDMVDRFLELLRAGSGSEPRTAETRIRSWNGDWHHVEIVATNRLDDPAVGGIVVNVRVVTDRVEAARQLAWQAYHDPLTGLINRTRLNAVLDEVPTPVGAEPLDLALLFVDLDGFKAVNDSLGHDGGDRLLVEVAHRLRREVRGADTVARLGGDEFVVVMAPAGDLDDLLRLGERIRRTVEAPVAIGPTRVQVTASIGIARQGVREAGQLLRRADLALYRAKESGRNRCEVFTES